MALNGLVRVQRCVEKSKAPRVSDVWATQACAKVLPPVHPPRLLLSIQDNCQTLKTGFGYRRCTGHKVGEFPLKLSLTVAVPFRSERQLVDSRPRLIACQRN